MAKSADALVNPALLTWARESAAMTLDEAAGRLRMRREKLEAWEEGSKRPTVIQLRKLSSLFKQSFAAFYLPEPPPVFQAPQRDYRRLPGEALGHLSSGLALEIRQSMDRRDVCLELIADQGGQPPQFTAQASLRRNPERLGDEIRKLLQVTLRLQQNWPDHRTAFNQWREAIEARGILVFQATNLDLKEMRGYSIAKYPLPVVVVNRKDTYSGRTFTLIHELVHLMLRSSGVCDLDATPGRPPEEQKTEVFCNHAAGAALVPEDLLTRISAVADHSGYAWDNNDLTMLAKHFRVSQEVVLRRLLILGLTSQAFYKRKRVEYERQYANRPRKEGFVPPSTNLISAAGKPFVRLVLEAFHADRITTSDVTDYLGLRLKHLARVGEAVGME